MNDREAVISAASLALAVASGCPGESRGYTLTVGLMKPMSRHRESRSASISRNL